MVAVNGWNKTHWSRSARYPGYEEALIDGNLHTRPMTSGNASLRNNVERLRQQLADAERQLEEAVKNCPHQWTQPIYAPIITEGYTIPPDGAGSDWRPACHVPRSEVKRWQRTCTICGEVQHTQNVKQETVEHPEFYD